MSAGPRWPVDFPLERLVFQGRTLRAEALAQGVLRLVLARPRARNAIDGTMIEEFEHLFGLLVSEEVRVLLLEGEGETFCAGADLGTMRAMAEATREENLEAAGKLGRIFYGLAAFPAPVVCVVQGAALGGGLGLAACADFVLARPGALFATTEVRLGLVPALISPYVVRKLGLAHAAPLMLTGRRIRAEEGLAMGLVQRVLGTDETLEEALGETLAEFLEAGPQAARRTKALLRLASPLPDPELVDATARALAEVRVSEEGQEGLRAFFDKRAPRWNAEPSGMEKRSQ